jgi:hypothetical protein
MYDKVPDGRTNGEPCRRGALLALTPLSLSIFILLEVTQVTVRSDRLTERGIEVGAVCGCLGDTHPPSRVHRLNIGLTPSADRLRRNATTATTQDEG